MINTQELIEYLQGSCKTLNEGVSDITDGVFNEDDLTKNQIEEIDNEIFCCSNCGWWCELSDQSEDGENCINCVED